LIPDRSRNSSSFLGQVSNWTVTQPFSRKSATQRGKMGMVASSSDPLLSVSRFACHSFATVQTSDEDAEIWQNTTWLEPEDCPRVSRTSTRDRVPNSVSWDTAFAAPAWYRSRVSMVWSARLTFSKRRAFSRAVAS